MRTYIAIYAVIFLGVAAFVIADGAVRGDPLSIALGAVTAVVAVAGTRYLAARARRRG